MIADQPWYVLVSIAELFCAAVDLEQRLEIARQVYAKAIETNEEASDHLLRLSDLIKALGTIQQLLNRAYYSSAELIHRIHTDEELYQSLKKAEQELIQEAVDSCGG